MTAPQPRAPDDEGVSLLELTAVMAIFSVLALLAVQLLSQGLTSRASLAQTDSRIAAISSAVAVLRRDLEQVLPLPQDNGPQPLFRIDGAQITMATVGAPRVIWRHDPQTQTLTRETAQGSIVMLEAVTDLDWQTFAAGDWRPGTAWRGTDPADLPRGLRALLTLGDLGAIPVVVAR